MSTVKFGQGFAESGGAEPLSPPTLSSPADAATGQLKTLSFDWSDVVGVAYYRIQIARDSNFTQVVYSATSTTSGYTMPGGILKNDETYYWRVNTNDGSFSSARSFTTRSIIPDLVSPLDGIINGVRAQNFDWTGSVDADTYHIQISDAVDFSNIVLEQDGLTVTSYTVPDDLLLTDAQTYYWRVRARNIDGYSDWSSERSLTINEAAIPDVPVLLSPADGVTYNGYTAIDHSWEVQDNVDTFEFQVATDTGFTSIISNQTGLTSTHAQFTPSTDGLKYWRVRAVNANGNSDWTAYRSYTTYKYQAETVSLLARMTNQPNSTRKDLIDSLIKGLKDDGLWSKLDVFWMFAAHTNAGGEALLNWKSSSYNCTLVGSPTFTTDRGFTGAGSTSHYIKTNWNPSTNASNFTRNSGSFGFFNRTNTVSGVDVGIVNFTELYWVGLTQPYMAINGGEWTLAPGVASSADGLWVGNRTGSTAAEGLRNGASVGTSSQSSATIPNAEVYILCRNNGGGTPGVASSHQISFVYYGAGLTQAEIASLAGRVLSFLTSIGAGVA